MLPSSKTSKEDEAVSKKEKEKGNKLMESPGSRGENEKKPTRFPRTRVIRRLGVEGREKKKKKEL